MEKPDLTGAGQWIRDLSTVERVLPPNASDQAKRQAMSREMEKRKLQLMAHEKSCGHRTVDCPGCGTKIVFRDLPEHRKQCDLVLNVVHGKKSMQDPFPAPQQSQHSRAAAAGLHVHTSSLGRECDGGGKISSSYMPDSPFPRAMQHQHSPRKPLADHYPEAHSELAPQNEFTTGIKAEAAQLDGFMGEQQGHLKSEIMSLREEIENMRNAATMKNDAGGGTGSFTHGGDMGDDVAAIIRRELARAKENTVKEQLMKELQDVKEECAYLRKQVEKSNSKQKRSGANAPMYLRRIFRV